jgi:LuxR family maltose regulon positive regulatory protein
LSKSRSAIATGRVVYIARAYIALVRNELDLAAHWLSLAEFRIKPAEKDLAFDEPDHYLVQASYLVPQGGEHTQQAVTILERLLDYVTKTGQLRLHIGALLQQALARHALGEDQAALCLLEDALRLGATENYTITFLTVGAPLPQLLARIPPESPQHAYAQRILAAFKALPSNSEQSLSEREIEILRYVASGLSNAKVAGELYISVNTVKAHLKSVFGKLGVSNRAAAVDRAHQLSLL